MLRLGPRLRDRPTEAAARLVAAASGSPWGPLAFIAIYLARPLLLISAALLTVAGGFLFGAAAGIAIVLVASNGSALVAYGAARWLVPAAAAHPSRRGLAARWALRLRERGFETVLVMRLLFLPYDLVSHLAGAARIRPLAFLAATAAGSAPATVAFVLAGASLERLDGDAPGASAWLIGLSAALIAAALAISRLIRRRERRARAAPSPGAG